MAVSGTGTGFHARGSSSASTSTGSKLLELVRGSWYFFTSKVLPVYYQISNILLLALLKDVSILVLALVLFDSEVGFIVLSLALVIIL